MSVQDTDGQLKTTLPMHSVVNAVAVGAFVAIFTYYEFGSAPRKYVHLVECTGGDDPVREARKHRDQILKQIEPAVFGTLSETVSQSNIALWNVLRNMKGNTPSEKLRKVRRLLESLPENNPVELAYGCTQPFCHSDSVRAALLMSLLHSVGLLDKTDHLGFSIPVRSGDIYDVAAKELADQDAKLQRRWSDMQPGLKSIGEQARVDAFDRAFRKSGLPNGGRPEIWYACIGRRRREMSPKPYAAWLKESKLISAEEKIQILKDVPRTFGHNNYRFSPTNKNNMLKQLGNLLMAKCARNPGTYWQGMSFIAGFILLQVTQLSGTATAALHRHRCPAPSLGDPAAL